MNRLAALAVAGLTVFAVVMTTIPATVAGQSYRPVTDERLVSPEPENWLSYRGNYHGWGYSPLDPDRRVQRAESRSSVGVLDKRDRRPRVPARRQ